MPIRIQRSRAKGWRSPPGAIYVGRPGVFGNKFPVLKIQDWWWVMEPGAQTGSIRFKTEVEARMEACRLYRATLPETVKLLARKKLRGHDLACWCALPKPGEPDACHAAVLLEISNAP